MFCGVRVWRCKTINRIRVRVLLEIMGLFDWFIGKKRHIQEPETLQSARTSARITSTALETALQSASTSATLPLQSQPKEVKTYFEYLPQTFQQSMKTPTNSAEIQKDSFQLGLAAGYTGKSIKEIEASLQRIESMMVSKDWFLSEFTDYTPELINIFKEHETNEQRRFEAILESLNHMTKVAETAPEPIRSELMEEITAIQKELPLTPKMKQVLDILKEVKEASYEDLASKLDIETSALRGLLTIMNKRTDQIERFKVNGQGWVRYKAL